MSVFDRMYRRLFPGSALKREIQRRRMERLQNIRSLDVISGGRSRFTFNTNTTDINSEVANSSSEIRKQMRQFELENGNIAGAFRRIKKNVIGSGIRVNAEISAGDGISEAQAEKANSQIEKYMDVWNRQADKRLMLPFYGADGIQGIVEHALLRDNEALVIGRNSGRKNRLIPYCLEVLETDRLETPPGELGNPRVSEGIRFDKEGAQEAFYVLKEHPGNTISAQRSDNDYEEIPAYNSNGTKKVMFLFNPIRPEQTRAFSLMASALKDVQDADRVMEAEKLGALEDACMFGTVKTDNIAGWDSQVNTSSGSDEYDRIHEFAPNGIYYLSPGESLDVHRPVRPNQQFEPFMDLIWRGPANSVDVPPEVFLQKWNGMNYSNARTVLLQFYATCRERQRFIINNLCYFVYENVFRWLVIRGLVEANTFYSKEYDWMRHSWIPPGWQWIDPKKEADGKEVEVNLGTETVSDIILSQGQDPKVKLERRAKELKYIKELESKYGVEMSTKTHVKEVNQDD